MKPDRVQSHLEARLGRPATEAELRAMGTERILAKLSGRSAKETARSMFKAALSAR